ncbi:MAG TPA: hypothetical protein VGM93_04205 [Acidimicrobiales bacterium]
MTATRRATARLDPDELASLEEQRDFLLRSLDDLEAGQLVGVEPGGDPAGGGHDGSAPAPRRASSTSERSAAVA